MDLRQRKSPTYRNRIHRLYWEINQIEDRRALRLSLESEKSKYTDWYSCGNAPDDMMVSDDGFHLVYQDGSPYEGWVPHAKSQAAWFLDSLFEAYDTAGVDVDSTKGLEPFQGAQITVETRDYTSNIGGTKRVKQKLAVVGLWTGGNGEATDVGVDKHATPDTDLESLTQVLHDLLVSKDGEFEATGINGGALRDVCQGKSYLERKTLADQLKDKKFLAAQKIASVDNGVITLR